MTSVYVVTAGAYSDYRICSVWDNLKDAEKELVKYGTGYDQAFVEEWTLNNSDKPHPPIWEASLKNEQITVKDKAVSALDVGDMSTGVAFNQHHGLVGWSYGVSPEIAIKKLSDAVAKYKAEKDNL